MEIGVTNLNYIYLGVMLVALLIVMHYISIRRTKKRAIIFSNYELLKKLAKGPVAERGFLILILRALALIFLFVSLAQVNLYQLTKVPLYDAVLAIDASQSMLLDDYKPNRLEAARGAAISLIDMVPEGMLLGVVSFAEAGETKAALSDDKPIVKEAVQNISASIRSGTAIGDALVESSILFEPEANGMILLLTDGRNNMGVNVEDSLDILEKKNIVVYTIGVGTERNETEQDLDEETLKKIANQTGGEYFRSVNESSLNEIYVRIASAVVVERRVGRDISYYFLIAACIFLVLEWLLAETKYKTIPV